MATKADLEALGIEASAVKQGRFERTDYVVDGYSFPSEAEAVKFAKADWPREHTVEIAPATLPGGRKRKGGIRTRLVTSDGYSYPTDEKGTRLAHARQANIDKGVI